MATLPNDPDYSHLSSGTKDPKQARSQLADLFVNVIDILNYLRGLFGSDGTVSTARTQLGLKALATRDTVTTTHYENSSITGGKVANDAITLAKMAHKTSGGGILGYDSNGAPIAIDGGTTDYVLTSNGSNAPSMQALPASGGAMHVETIGPVTSYTDGNSVTFTFASTFGHRNYVVALYAKATNPDLSYEGGEYVEVTEGFSITRNQGSAIVRVASDGLKARPETDDPSTSTLQGMNDGDWDLYFVAIGA